MSAADGSVSSLIDAGTYSLKISKPGYKTFEKNDEFRVLIKEQSFVAIMGFLALGLICGGVYYMFRKYSRR